MSQMERKQSRKRLRPWLEYHANARTYKGLRWLDEEKKIFLISWKHQSSRNWDASDGELFKAWALHTGKYKEGDPENYPEWKTRLRTALTKLSDIEEMKELHNLSDQDNPYKAYRFLDEGVDCSSKLKSQPSPLSEAGYSDSSGASFQTSPNSQIDFLEISDTEMVMESVENVEQHGGMNDMNNIPTVVMDQITYNMNIKEEKPSNLHASNAYEFPMNPECDISDFHVGGMYRSNDHNDMGLHEQHPLPQDLQGIESDHLVPLNDTLTPNNMSLGSSLPSFESIPSMGSLNTNHVLKMQVYIVGKCVFEEFIDEGARLFCGDLLQQYKAIEHPDHEKTFGSMNLKQIAIPEIDKMDNLPDVNCKQKKFVRDIQNNMDRGLLIGGNSTGIYTQRLCKAHVSTWTQRGTVEKLNRGNIVINVFDMALFKQQLHEHSPESLNQPSTSVTFIFGQQYKGDLAVLDMNCVLFCVKVTHLEAQRLLQQAVNSTSSITEDLTSKSNPEDALADHLKQIHFVS